jgi:hypothetical protein
VCVLGCFGLVALATLTRARSWSAKWMTMAGALTYPVYLMHDNLGGYLISRTHDRIGPWGAVLVATAAVLVAAYLVQRFVEKPFGPKLRGVTRRMLERAPADTADSADTDRLAVLPVHAAASGHAELPAWAPEPRTYRRGDNAPVRMPRVARAEIVTGAVPADRQTLITARSPSE